MRLGVYMATRPRYSTTVVVTGTSYYYAGGVYYVQSGAGYVVTSAPPGAVVYAVPAATTVVYVGATPYYYVGGTYYVATTAPAPQPEPTTVNVNVNVEGAASGQQGSGQQDDGQQDFMEHEPEMTDDDHNFEVVAPPTGATVPYLPDEAYETNVNGKMYYFYDETFYKPFTSEGETIFMVVEDPRGNGSQA